MKAALMEKHNYIMRHLVTALEEVQKLDKDIIYFELTKEEILKYLKQMYDKFLKWIEYIEKEDYQKILDDDFDLIDSIASELEICLVEHDAKFNMGGISFTISQFGEMVKLEVKNEKRK